MPGADAPCYLRYPLPRPAVHTAPAAHVIKPLLLTKMWNIMVFADESHTSLVRVLQMRTVKDVGTLVHLPASTVSNFYHRLIKPKGALKYIAMFKA